MKRPWIRTATVLAIIILAPGPLAGQDDKQLHWRFIRDGAIYFQPARTEQVTVRWRPAWLTDANEDRLFLQDAEGNLVGERRVAPGVLYGEHPWALDSEAGPYRLEVPGYSFRNFEILHAKNTAAMFEPAKVHFSSEVPPGLMLYFAVPAESKAVLNGKYYGGVRRLRAARLSDGVKVDLKLVTHQDYRRFDSIELPSSKKREVWRLEMYGSGKIAFWLDGASNFFSQHPEHLFNLSLKTGRAQLFVNPKSSLGAAPLLGLAMPYSVVPAHARRELNALSIRTASFYSFLDILEDGSEREREVRQAYQHELSLVHDVTILARSGRRPLLDADDKALRAVDTWVEAMADLGGPTVHYLAFADEPNLNYPSYEAFESYFVKMARRVRSHPRAAEGNVRILAPASSRFVDGPTRDGSNERVGMDWTRKLLREHADLIDAVGWHWWQHRDLFDVRAVRQDIRAAAELVKWQTGASPGLPLIISQSNISSGNSLSPYEQETDFAALWWTGLAVNAAIDGLLANLMWFKAVDDDGYSKGAFGVQANGRLVRKPVAHAMEFIGRYWEGDVLETQNSSFEVDAVGLNGPRGVAVVGVNKGGRAQELQVEVKGASESVLASFETLEFDEGQPRRHLRCQAIAKPFELPPRAIFALTLIDQVGHAECRTP